MARRLLLTTVLPVLAAVAAGVLVLTFVLQRSTAHSFAGTTFYNPGPAPDLGELLFDDGTPADLTRYRGEVVLIYFGYTSCPDVCPLTLTQARLAIQQLGDRGDDVQLFMISVDPARDTLDQLGEYVRFFDERFQGIGGDLDAVTDVATRYGVYFEAEPPDETGFYEVTHTSSLMGIDRDGDLQVIWNPDVEAEPLAADIEELLG